MTTKLKFKICDWSLLLTTILVTVSSIQLEVLGGGSQTWVWVHIALTILFFALILWHIYLHFRWGNWPDKLFGKQNLLRWMSVFGLLVIVSACMASAHWLSTFTHNGIGALHGKLGFIFLILVIIHAVKHRKFYKQ